jgi:hypothetical protein
MEFGSFLIIMLAAVWARPGQVSIWQNRNEMIEWAWMHFERAFVAKTRREPYTDNEVYALAVMIAMFIYNRWVGDGERNLALAQAFAVAAQTDPLKNIAMMNAVMNIVAVVTIMGEDEAGRRACEGDFLARCAAVIRAGGLFGEHNAMLVTKWVSALPVNDTVAEFAAAVLESENVEGNMEALGDIDRILGDFVGWRRGEW